MPKKVAKSDGDVVVNVRLPEGWVERADALVEALAADDEVLALATPSRSTVLRLAVLRGLAQLESERGIKPRKR